MEDIPLLKHRIADDVVEYCLYLTYTFNDQNYLKTLLTDYLHKCQALVLQLTSNHIWQYEPFNLHVVTDCKLPHLAGSTHFGDSVDDEWLIVYLLLELTKAFSQLIAFVQDTDGQFLLVEAAEHIPRWLTPDTCKNRVFLFRGNLHILLKPTTPGDVVFCPAISPVLEYALKIVTKFSEKTVAKMQIRACIVQRISCYPQKITTNKHFANVFIPKKLVYIFDRRPNFISKCVNSFYLRDPIDLKSCRTFKYMDPCQRVWTQVPMTRCHYAQLMQQRFCPDKRSGYQMPKNLSVAEEKGIDLGLKLAHGCEIIFSAKHFDKFYSQTTYDANEFSDYIDTLRECGYFKNEREGSKHYQELLNKAKEYYLSSFVNNTVKQNCSYAIVDVFQMFDSVDFNNDTYVLENLQVQSSLHDLPKESSDQWMYLDENDVQNLAEKMTEGFSLLNKAKKSESKCQKRSDCSVFKKQTQLKDTVEKVNNFVSGVSDYTGVEVEKQPPLQFDSKEFVTSLEKILNVSCTVPINNDNNSQSSADDSDDFLSSEDDVTSINSENEKIDFNKWEEYMQCMNNELADTVISKSFVKATNKSSNTDERIYDHDEVDIDANLLENFLLGKNEETLCGPINNILESVHADLPLSE